MEPRREKEIANALVGPPMGGQDEMSMKSMGPNNMSMAIDMIHLLSGELKQKNRVAEALLQETEAVRQHLHQRQETLSYVTKIIDAVVTPEGQAILRKYHGLKEKDVKKFEEAKHKTLVQLRDHLIKQRI